MQSTDSPFSSEVFFEYMLVIRPHEALRIKLQEIKTDFSTRFCTKADFGEPRIALLRYAQLEGTEQNILKRFSQFARSFAQIKIDLRDFVSLPSHTIYIQVVSKLALESLVKGLRTASQDLLKIDKQHKPYFIMEPTIAIARKMLPNQYEKAWAEFRHKSFNACFIAEEMLLLKRSAAGGSYKLLHRFAFENLKPIQLQGGLFD